MHDTRDLPTATEIAQAAKACFHHFPYYYFDAIHRYAPDHAHASPSAAERYHIMAHGTRPAWGRNLESYCIQGEEYTFLPARKP